MADFQSMRAKIRRDSVLILTLMFVLILLFLFHDEYIELIQQIGADGNIAEIFEKNLFGYILTILSPVVAYLFGLISIAKRDLYYKIDNWIFKRRKKIDRFICEELLNIEDEVTLSSSEEQRLYQIKRCLHNERLCSKILRTLFYPYIEKADIVNPELKNQAFIYWGDYFSKIIFATSGFGAFFVVLAIYVFDGQYSWLRAAVFFLILAFSIWSLSSSYRGKASKKQLEIPRTQIEQIHKNAASQILEDIREYKFFVGNDW